MRSPIAVLSLFSAIVLSSTGAIAAAPPQTYINTAIARTVELGGATTHITTQYNVKLTADGPGEYHLALAGQGEEEPAWWEVSIGSKAVEGVTVLDST